MRIANLLIACVALVVCAWFVIGIRQARTLDQATAIVTQSPTPTRSELAHAASLLRSAATLNPDLQVKLVRASLALVSNQPALAERIAKAAVHDEPQNLLAWYELAKVAGRDQRTFFGALAEIKRLDPAPPRSR